MLARKKRDTETSLVKQFSPDCNSAIHFWTRTQIRFASSIIPAIGVNRALDIITQLGCWMSKEANATSDALEGLLKDLDQEKKISLQNRAAIDYLLLVHGHGCEDFEGMCCMNFSTNAQTIHSKIQDLRKLVGELKVRADDGRASDIFDWFPNLSLSLGLRRFITMLIIGIVVVIVVLLTIPCIIKCVRRSVSASFPVLENKKGGDVGIGKEKERYAEWKEELIQEESV